MKILIVEDETEISKLIQESLEEAQYLVESASTFKEGLLKIEDYQYDAILLDLMHPDGNGLDLLSEIRSSQPNTSVIILSAKDAVEDKVKGLDLGADDYLAKPFHLVELHSRLKSALRRRNQQGENKIEYKNLCLYPETRDFLVAGNHVALNRKEYDVLYYFMIRPGRLIQRTTLAESVWGDHIDQADSLDFIYSQIKNLRKKLKESGADADLQAVYGVGYKLV
jgi:DNA-binding response OmpR family regulator